MAGTIFGLARVTCSAKYMIRANWSLVGGLRIQLSPTQAKPFQVARRHTSVALMSFASQVTLANGCRVGVSLHSLVLVPKFYDWQIDTSQILRPFSGLAASAKCLRPGAQTGTYKS